VYEGVIIFVLVLDRSRERKGHNFRSRERIYHCQSFQKRFRTPLGYLLPHLLVHQFKKKNILLPGESVLKKVKCLGSVVTTPSPTLDLSS